MKPLNPQLINDWIGCRKAFIHVSCKETGCVYEECMHTYHCDNCLVGLFLHHPSNAHSLNKLLIIMEDIDETIERTDD